MRNSLLCLLVGTFSITLSLQAQVRNPYFDTWLQAEPFGEPYDDPLYWTTTNESHPGTAQANLSVTELQYNGNSIAKVESSFSGLDGLYSGAISQKITLGNSKVISMRAKCDSLSGNGGCILSIRDVNGQVLQSDTTKTLDNDYRQYELVIEDQVLAAHSSVVVWIEAFGITDPWDNQEDGYAVFLIDEVQAVPEAFNFEFLDHRHKFSRLGAAEDTKEGILYVSMNSEQPMTTINLVNNNCEVTQLFDYNFGATHSSIQVLDDSTYFVTLMNFIDYDVILGGFVSVTVQNGAVLQVHQDFDPILAEYYEPTNSVTVDTSGAWIVDSDIDGHFSYNPQDSTQTPISVTGSILDLFIDKSGDWFLYSATDLFYYNGSTSAMYLTNQNIKDVKYSGSYNYLLSPDTLFRYDENFYNLIDMWSLPASDISFDRIYLSDSKVTFLTNGVTDFSIREITSASVFDTTYAKSPDENLSIVSYKDERTLTLSGKYNYNTNWIVEHLFFRDFSLYEENLYDRVDISLDDYRIEYDSTLYEIDPFTGDSVPYHNYKISTTVMNHQDRAIFSLGAFTYYYNTFFGPLESYLTVNLQGDIIGNGPLGW